VTDGRPVIAAYATPAQRAPLMAELDYASRHGGPAPAYELLDGAAVQRAEPALGPAARAAVRIDGQRYLDPAAFAAALAASIRRRGGQIRSGIRVTAVRPDRSGVTVAADGSDGGSRYDSVVVATGAWVGLLARPAGVRVRVQSGRGYSFSVPVRQLPAGPVYLPGRRLACTPLADGRLRVAGIMEFAPPEAPLDRCRVARMAAGLDDLLADADAATRTDEWVGARPCTPDGLPVIGATRAPRVFVAGGHGMWALPSARPRASFWPGPSPPAGRFCGRAG
jgi:D-amino-acid dehydrogenase